MFENSVFVIPIKSPRDSLSKKDVLVGSKWEKVVGINFQDKYVNFLSKKKFHLSLPYALASVSH